jgi:hypothetical protein
MILSAFISEIPLIVIICRFGLMLDTVYDEWELRVSNAFGRVVTSINKFLDISR